MPIGIEHGVSDSRSSSRLVSSHAGGPRSSRRIEPGGVSASRRAEKALDMRFVAALRALRTDPSTLAMAIRRADQTLKPLHVVLTEEFGFSDHVMARAAALVFGLNHMRGPDIDLNGDLLAKRIKAGLDIGHIVPLHRHDGGPVWVIGYSSRAIDLLVRLEAQADDRSLMPGIATRQTLTERINESCGTEIVRQATEGLAEMAPMLSASTGLTDWQKAVLAGTGAILVAALIVAPVLAIAVTGLILSLFFAGNTVLRIAAAGQGLWRVARGKPLASAPRKALKDADLPRYTVLIPLHREAGLLPHIQKVVAAFDYPAEKLDIKLLLEQSDGETVDAAEALRWPSHVTLLKVPDLGPKTKPKAMNAALPFATGDIIVVYDAEDRPDPGQLRLAAETFAALPHETAVLQARLMFFNRHENWLAGQFAIEYAAHFGFLLPALEAMGLPVPLGGTSNHIRLDILRHVGGWDAFNVTEDADLGLRIQALGCRTRMIDSVTEEEAACQWNNWLKQRTRWQKGWIQTYGVHTRQPFKLMGIIGPVRFLGFQAMIGGLILSPVAHLVFAVVAVVALWQGWLLGMFDGGPLAWAGWIAVFNLFAGYTASLSLGLLAVAAAGWEDMRWKVLTMPVYWFGIAVACLRAVKQLFRDPFTWEKTRHGVSGLVRERR